MIIAIDLRALSSGNHSGVEVYIEYLLKNILSIDKVNKYILFMSGYKLSEHTLIDYIKKHYANIFFVHAKYPNKLFNLTFSKFRYPKIDLLIHKKTGLQPDIFFVPDIRPAPISKKCKKIITIHDLAYKHFPKFFSLKSKIWYKYINPLKEIKEADHIISISNNTKQDLCETYKVAQNKSTVIYQGVEKSFGNNMDSNYLNKIKNKYELPAKYFLYLATLEPRKNIYNLLKAFTDFQRNNTEYYLLICGKENKKIFQSVKIPSHLNIITTGFIPEEDKPGVFNLARAFIYPSFFEGFGLPLLESMKCKTPIITSNTSSMPEVVIDSALLIDPNSPHSIRAAMELIIKPSVKEQLLKKMNQRIKKFSWQYTAENTLRLFETTFDAEYNPGQK